MSDWQRWEESEELTKEWWPLIGEEVQREILSVFGDKSQVESLIWDELPYELQYPISCSLYALANGGVEITVVFPHMDKQFMLNITGDPNAVWAVNCMLRHDLNADKKCGGNIAARLFHQGTNHLENPTWALWEYWVDYTDSTKLDRLFDHMISFSERIGEVLR